MSKYIAVIGDLINSKNIENRNTFQENLRKNLYTINKKYSDSIASNFTLTIGDEFQALLELDSRTMEILDNLCKLIPHPFRLGIGYGEITTKINPRLSIGSDGPAYWNARKAIDLVHNSSYKNKSNIYFISQDQVFDSNINTLFLLSETLKGLWTDTQKTTFIQMLDHGIYTDDFNQKAFAESIGITETSLSKRLNLGNIKVYLRARNEINDLLEVHHAK